ncbi:MAG: SRPBCC domain-containing protein [Myxococcota bacterium]
MKSFEARITIQAPREKIWAILTDAAAYPSWNTTITKIEGTISPGQSLKIWTTLDPKRAFPAKVSEMQAPQRMVWSFSAPLGMFKGARTFTLEEKGGGAVEFHTREEFSGWLSGPITSKMPDLQPSFDAWAACLKRRAESA